MVPVRREPGEAPAAPRVIFYSQLSAPAMDMPRLRLPRLKPQEEEEVAETKLVTAPKPLSMDVVVDNLQLDLLAYAAERRAEKERQWLKRLQAGFDKTADSLQAGLSATGRFMTKKRGVFSIKQTSKPVRVKSRRYWPKKETLLTIWLAILILAAAGLSVLETNRSNRLNALYEQQAEERSRAIQQWECTLARYEASQTNQPLNEEMEASCLNEE